MEYKPEKYPAYHEIWTYLKEIHEMYTSVDWWYTWWIWVSSIFNGVRSLFGFAAAGVLLQQIVQDYANKGYLTQTTVLWAVGIAIVFGIIGLAIPMYGYWRSETFREKIARKIEVRRIQTLLSLDLGRLWDPKFIALKDKFGWRGTEAHKGLVDETRHLIGNCVAVTAGFGILLALEPILMLITFIPIIPTVIERFAADQRRRASRQALLLKMRLKDAYSAVLTDERRVVQSKLVRSTDYIWNQYSRLLDLSVNAERDLDWQDTKTRSFVQAIAFVCYVAALAYLGMRVVGGSLSMTQVFLVAGAVQAATSNMSAFALNIADLKARGLDYRYVLEYMSAKPLIDETGAGEITLNASPRISAEALRFKYPSQDQLALDGCSFVIKPCERVAVVGRNGSGKTTVMRMLSKVFLPEGTVSFNGTPLREITQKSLLRHVMYVTQDAELPELYLRDIIAACEPEDVNHERLRRAASFVDFVDTLDSLPLKLETILDPSWPDGIDMSGGQRQRLKLVAAFYRLLDPQVHIGIFDEPMSNCDPETRELFYAALKSLSDKTIIVVAHDPLYLHHFERVIVMASGSVLQDLRGEHQIDEYRNELALSLSDDLFFA